MNRFAVLSQGFEHLSYPLDRHNAADGSSFSEQSERFSLSPAQSEPHAQMVLVASDYLATHASEPVGYVCSGEGEIFVVCRTTGRGKGEIAKEERRAFSLSVVRRLAALHTDGFGCGGLSPGAVEFSGREAKLLHPSRIFALHEGETTFYEAVSTLRALVSEGMASEDELRCLSGAYLSHSPVCRHGIVEHLQKKGISAQPKDALVSAALKFAAYF